MQSKRSKKKKDPNFNKGSKSAGECQRSNKEREKKREVEEN